MMNVGIIGAGAWGSALAIIVARGGARVRLWSYDGQCKHFEDVPPTDAVRITGAMSDMADMGLWLIATPAAFFRETLRQAAPHYQGQPIIICTKGMEAASGAFMSEILGEELPECHDFGVLSGPQFAAEVARGVETGSTLAGTDAARAAGCRALRELHLEESGDVVGAEICGVGKNAVALICGYNSIAANGENERALRFTQAWGDVVAIGIKSGAKLETFLGLCGMGDLFLSATSPTSRNFSGGVALARGDAPCGTVEGIFALRGLIARAARMGVRVDTLKSYRDKMGL